MRKIVKLSPNYSQKNRGKKNINFVIIHYTGMQSEIESLNKLRDPKSKVSCHYLINRKGTLVQMVKEKDVAWHAGKSKWKNFKSLNHNSIGIELENKGHTYGYENFTKSQLNCLVKLCKRIKSKYSIENKNFLGHSDIAPLRKIDPGEKFPWKKLSKFNIGYWYKKNNKNFNFKSKKEKRKIFFKNLYKIGYRYFKLSKPSKTDKKIISSFQMKFLPSKVTGKIDSKTFKISHFLANYD